MYALVLDIVAGNCFVEMQRCERASVVFRPVTCIGSGILFEDCNRSIITTSSAKFKLESQKLLPRSFNSKCDQTTSERGLMGPCQLTAAGTIDDRTCCTVH
jgi:hypothetical protein